MKPRHQVLVLGVALLGVAAWSSMRRGEELPNAGQACSTCFPFPGGLDAKPMADCTNATVIITNTPAGTNHL